MGGHISLADFPIEAVGKEAVGELQEEFSLQRLLQAMQAHVVFEKAVDDRFTDTIGIFGSRFNSVALRAKGLAAGAAGAVFSYREFNDHDLTEGDISNLPRVGVFASPELAAFWARKGLWGARFFDNANARLNGFHACVPLGLVWRPP
jgi:hypothetical protein